MITFVTQYDLFSGEIENNHDNVNKDGSFHYEFSTVSSQYEAGVKPARWVLLYS
jgi:hypothetical protein